MAEQVDLRGQAVQRSLSRASSGRWSSPLRRPTARPIVVVNAAEGEPGGASKTRCS